MKRLPTRTVTSRLFCWLLLLPACTSVGEKLGDHDGDLWRDCGDWVSTEAHPCDCNDNAAQIHPGQAEVCNTLDDDCDGLEDGKNQAGELIDNEGLDFRDWYTDADEDGFGDPASLSHDCKSTPEETLLGDDCDDANSEAYPGADETCDGLDNDCDGKFDEELLFTIWYPDNDGDGYGDQAAEGIEECQSPNRYAPNAQDCDDRNDAIHPGAEETCDKDNGIDNNCDGSSDDNADLDGDGSRSCDDCNDSDPQMRPKRAEICDGKDNNCDVEVDNAGAQTWFRDRDGDGYGDPDEPETLTGCDQPGYALNSLDCNDNPKNNGESIHPGAGEDCDAIDNDCDGNVDEGLGLLTWYPDQDGDSYGDANADEDDKRVQCPQPEGYVSNAEDCQDDPLQAGASFHPYAVEYCPAPGTEGQDFNCDGLVGEGDRDGDGIPTCQPAENAGVDFQTDCNDADFTIYPGAPELCDGKDNDCNEVRDDVGFQDWYRDADGDGWGVQDNPKSLLGCTVPGWSLKGGPDRYDCDDDPSNDAASSPGAAQINPDGTEVCDGVDDNCDGIVPPEESDDDKDEFLECATTITAADCNDQDKTISPAAVERCNLLDDNCDGQIDVNPVDGQAYYLDMDGDLYGINDPTLTVQSCVSVEGRVTNHDDCNDSRADVNPSGQEICDFFNVDEDCDGDADDTDDSVDPTGMLTFYPDSDGDGYGDETAGDGKSVTQCDAPDNMASSHDDCNDRREDVYPGAPEACGDGLDHNCDGATSDENTDKDGDGVAACLDCNDLNASIYPGAAEVCDEQHQDEDCDGKANDDDLQGASGVTAWYPDTDGDSFGDQSRARVLCAPPVDSVPWLAQGGDCNDSNANIYPYAPERCNGIDDDCDGAVDDDPAGGIVWYRDADQDAYGQASRSLHTCTSSQPPGYVSNGLDCDDANAQISPASPEQCDGKDNDCDARVDDADDDVQNAPSWYLDGDLDTYGGLESAVSACNKPSGYLAQGGDCDDSDSTIHPGVTEVCDDIDANCDGSQDEELKTPYYRDEDGDGYGSTTVSTSACLQPGGYVASTPILDCNDQSAAINPAAEELPANGIDEDCDGLDATPCGALEGVAVYVSPGGEAPCDGVPGSKSVQQAITMTSPGGVIVVAAGTYPEALNIQNKSLILRSENIQRGLDPDQNQFTLTGSVSGSVLQLLGGNVTLEGFRLTGGTGSPGKSNTCFDGSSNETAGGAICARGTTTTPLSLTLRHLTMTGNEATYGGELYVRDATTLAEHLTLPGDSGIRQGGGIFQTGGSLTLRESTLSGFSGATDGAALYITHGNTSGSTTLETVTLADNTASSLGGGLYFYSLDTSRRLTLRGVDLLNNIAASAGGGLYITANGPVGLQDLSFSGNVSSSGGGGGASLSFGSGANVTAERLDFNRNITASSGGGLNMTLSSGSTGTFTDLTFVGNVASHQAGALYLSANPTTATFDRLSFEGNRASREGGGISASLSANATLKHLTLNDNISGTNGGGLYLSGGGRVEDVLIENAAAQYGGGVYLTGSTALSRVTIRNARAQVDGGGLYCASSSAPMVRNLQVVGNSAVDEGGGVYFYAGTNCQLYNASIVRNRAYYTGGGVHLYSNASPGIYNSIVAYNSAAYRGSNVHYDGSSATPSFVLMDILLYNPESDGDALYGISEFVLQNFRITQAEPGFIRDVRYGALDVVDLHLRSDSPARDKGSSSDNDPDGSPNDIGVYGGRDSASTDQDRDGLPDDWETLHGLDTTRDDAQADTDGDGFIHQEEYERGLVPTDADSDGDGVDDEVEVNQGTHPLDPFDAVAEGKPVIQVPSDLDRVQEALDEAFPGTEIRLAPGTYQENLWAAFKSLTLTGEQGRDLTTLKGDGTQSVLLLYGMEEGTTVSDLTITGGKGSRDSNSCGGGVMAQWSTASFDGLLLIGNTAYYGGGMYQNYGTSTVQHSVFQGNTASNYGGGMYQNYGTSTVQHSVFQGNTADSAGGGMHQYQGTSTVQHSMFQGNTASYGGGMHQYQGTGTVQHSVFQGNTASNYGGGVYNVGTLILQSSILSANSSVYDASTSNWYNSCPATGSGYNLYYVSPTQDGINCTLDSTNKLTDPLFLDPANGDFHLAKSPPSPAINEGNSSEKDPDNSTADIGLYGGPGADDFDRDNDGFFDYFWPGTWQDVPSGFDQDDYDCDDQDADVYPGSGC